MGQRGRCDVTSGSKGESSGAEFTDPVCRLLTIGDSGSADPEDWPDYVAEFGLDPAHIPDLIRLACDTGLSFGNHADDRVMWASMHAWRALGQMRAEDAVVPLLALSKTMEGDEPAAEEIPEVLGMIGPPAIPHIAAYLGDSSNMAVHESAAIDGIRQIVRRNSGCRDECIGILTGMLESDSLERRLANGFAVSVLIDFRAVEAIDTIREAFQRDVIDISIAGDIEDVELDLGLRTRRSTPRPKYFSAPFAFDGFFDSHADAPLKSAKVGRNDPCPCGSGKKYKKCCLQ